MNVVLVLLVAALVLLVVLHRQLHGLRRDVRGLYQKETHMGKELDDLVAQVTKTDGVMQSAAVALGGVAAKLDALAEQLAAAGIDNTAVVAMSGDLKTNTDALAAAIVAVPA